MACLITCYGLVSAPAPAQISAEYSSNQYFTDDLIEREHTQIEKDLNECENKKIEQFRKDKESDA